MFLGCGNGFCGRPYVKKVHNQLRASCRDSGSSWKEGELARLSQN